MAIGQTKHRSTESRKLLLILSAELFKINRTLEDALEGRAISPEKRSVSTGFMNMCGPQNLVPRRDVDGEAINRTARNFSRYDDLFERLARGVRFSTKLFRVQYNESSGNRTFRIRVVEVGDVYVSTELDGERAVCATTKLR